MNEGFLKLIDGFQVLNECHSKDIEGPWKEDGSFSMSNDGPSILNEGQGILSEGRGILNDGRGILNEGHWVGNESHWRENEGRFEDNEAAFANKKNMTFSPSWTRYR